MLFFSYVTYTTNSGGFIYNISPGLRHEMLKMDWWERIFEAV